MKNSYCVKCKRYRPHNYAVGTHGWNCSECGMEQMNILGVILARGGSSRLLNKNLLPLGGMSLTARAAKDASLSRLITCSVISTDSETIAKEATLYGVEWIKRPNELSTDTSKIEDAARHALISCETQRQCRFDYVVSMQSAVPIRPDGAIDAMIEAVIDNKTRGGVTVVSSAPWVWQVGADGLAKTWWDVVNGYPRSQDVKHETFSEINSIQISPREEVLAGKRWGSPLLLFVLPRFADVDIDVADDYADAVARWPNIEKQLKHEAEYKSRVVKVGGGQ